MPLALLAALTSLFAVVWPGQQRQPVVPAHQSTAAAPAVRCPRSTWSTSTPPRWPLRGLLPAVILLTDGCACADQVIAAAAAAPAGVTVIVVTSGRSRPSPLPSPPPAVAGPLHALADPAAELRDFIQADPPARHRHRRAGRPLRRDRPDPARADLTRRLPGRPAPAHRPLNPRCRGCGRRGQDAITWIATSTGPGCGRGRDTEMTMRRVGRGHRRGGEPVPADQRGLGRTRSCRRPGSPRSPGPSQTYCEQIATAGPDLDRPIGAGPLVYARARPAVPCRGTPAGRARRRARLATGRRVQHDVRLDRRSRSVRPAARPTVPDPDRRRPTTSHRPPTRRPSPRSAVRRPLGHPVRTSIDAPAPIRPVAENSSSVA